MSYCSSFKPALWLVFLLIITACDRSEKKAREKFNQARSLVKEALLYEKEDEERSLNLYKQASQSLEALFTTYPLSQTAQDLKKQGIELSENLDWRKLVQNKIPALSARVAALNDPLLSASMIAKNIKSEVDQAEVLQIIAAKKLQTGAQADATQDLHLALSLLENSKAKSELVSLLVLIAQDLGKAGQTQQALQLLTNTSLQIKDLSAGDNEIWADALYAFYELGDAAGAALFFEKAKVGGADYLNHIKRLSVRLLEKGLCQQALAAVDLLSEAAAKVELSIALAPNVHQGCALSFLGQFSAAAMRSLSELKSAASRISALSDLARINQEFGRKSEAREYLVQALKLAQESALSAEPGNIEALLNLAASLSDASQAEEASSILATAINLTAALKNTEVSEVLKRRTVSALANNGHMERAAKVAALITLPLEKCLAWIEIAKAWKEFGEQGEAIKALAQVMNEIDNIKASEQRTRALIALRDLYTLLGEDKQALATSFRLQAEDAAWKKNLREWTDGLIAQGQIDLAIEAARAVEDKYLSSVILIDAAKKISAAAPSDESEKLILEALNGVDLSSGDRAAAMVEYFLKSLLQMRQPQKAAKLFSSHNVDRRALWLSKIASCFGELGMKNEALENLQQALASISPEETLYDQAIILAEIGAVYKHLELRPDPKSKGSLRRLIHKSSLNFKENSPLGK